MRRKCAQLVLRLSSIRSQIIIGFGIILGSTLIIVLVNLLALQNLQVAAGTSLDDASGSPQIATTTEEVVLSGQRFQDMFRESATISIVGGLLVLGVGTLTTVLLARRVISPLDALSEAAQEIGRGNLNQSVDVSGKDEFAALGRVFNQMSAQLRDLVGSLEQLVADRTRALSASFHVSHRLSTILNQQELIEEVVEQVQTVFDCHHVQVYLFDEEDRSLVLASATGEVERKMSAQKLRPLPGEGIVGKVVESGQPVLARDVTTEPSWRPRSLPPRTKSEAAVPIALGSTLLGVLDAQHDTVGGLNNFDVELLQSIANQVAIALQNARLYKEAQRKAEREALINTINEKIQNAATLEDVLQTSAKELGQALGARKLSVQLGDMERSTRGQSENGRLIEQTSHPRTDME